ncbi:MAG TPA: helical backbone metal receptor [bacterium]|nr:helical backbone metal receptor [bacterium]
MPKKKLPLRFLLALGLFLFSTPVFAYSRIVSLKPNLTEILFALGAGPEVIGVTTWCKRPQAAVALPKVADYIQAFPEEILRLNPDLVVGTVENGSQKEVQFLLGRGVTVLTLGSAANSSAGPVEALKILGYPVDGLGFATVEQTRLSIEALGALLGKKAKGVEIAGRMRGELEALKAESANLPKTKVLYVVGYRPLVVAGGNNFFDQAGEYIGALNVARESRLKYPYYTTELLIRAAPEAVFDFAMGSESSDAARQGHRDFWKAFPSIPAVKNGRIYPLNIETMRAAPELPATLREMFRLLHSTPSS